MLPPFIIEQIRQREEDERRRNAEQPRLELPVDGFPVPPEREAEDEAPDDEPERGVVIIDL